jgi:hypothetical protein
VVLEGAMVVRVVVMRVVGPVGVGVIDVETCNTAPEDVRVGSEVL